MIWRLLALLLCAAAAGSAADKSLHLKIGDPARKDKEARVVLDGITDTSTGALVTPRELVALLPSSGIVFVGELHTSMEFHRAQMRVIEELARAGRKVLVGLEMYPYTEQRFLDEWSNGSISEESFLETSHWYKNWGYHWNYYRDIFLFTKARGIRMFAVNAPRDVVTAVRRKGFKNLTPEEAAHVPARIDSSNAEHFTLFKAFFEGEEGMHSSMPEEAWKSMFDAQCTWDATMGYNAVRALKEHGDADTVMVVLIGSGHVAYGLGIQRQAAQWFDGKMASVVPIPIHDDKEKPVSSVQASYADFIWGVPREKDPLYPELGISTTEMPGLTRRKVIDVAKDSIAKDAGFQTGDVLLAMDGRELGDREILNRLLSAKRWGDEATFVVKRGEGEVALKAYFRRRPPAPK